MRQDVAACDSPHVARVEFGVENNSPVSNERDNCIYPLLRPSLRRQQTVAPSSIHSAHRSRMQAASQVATDRATEAAARLMSETAHDLRSPLTTVRESMRIVHDGDLGELSADQQACLASAIAQCGCMEQMIGEMVQLERLRTGTPRVNRHWVPVAEVRRAVDQSLRPWSTPRQIEVLWDGADDPRAKVFADNAMLRRLIVNLVTNAICATPKGGCVLIRLEPTRGNEAICWSVVDRGCGISEGDMKRIADRQVSLGGGEGLGLSICRQLAAVHFSSLQIRSRLGTGTAVSFETAAAGPRSVAQAWARWRVAFRGPLQTPQRRDQPAVVPAAGPYDRTMRLDPPSVSIELSHEATKPRCVDRLSAGIVSLGATVSRQAAGKFDEQFQAQIQMFDFAYRVDTRRWVWGFDTDLHGVQDRIDSIADVVVAQIPNIRMSWSEPQMIPIDARGTHARLSDLLIRETLSASAANHVLDKNEVRLGTAPLAPSDVAAARLDEELCRLTRQFGSQTTKLQQQAQSLRLG